MILNFGHTFGHALESYGGYSNISHGRAVGIGMLVGFNLSVQLGSVSHQHFQSANILIHKLLGRFNLNSIDYRKIWKLMLNDKKAKDDAVRFILLEKIGQPMLKEIDYKQFKKGLIL